MSSFANGNSPLPSQPVHFSDTGQMDAFDRLRVSIPTSYFSSVLQYHKNSHLWKEKITGSATSVLMDYEPSVLMSCPAIGDEVIRQTLYWPYQAGNSQYILITSLLHSGIGGESEASYGDDENGVRIIRKVDGEVYIELLSKVSGVVVPRTFRQNEWNCDTFSSTGINPSRVKLDLSQTQIFWIDLEFLAVGRLRCGFVFDGRLYVAHDFKNDNKYPSPYMSTASLPVRYRVKNVSSASPIVMKAICATVKSEGGSEIFGYPQVATFGPIDVASGARIPALSIRPAELYQGRPNRGIIIPISFSLFVTGNVPVQWELIHGGALTGATYANTPMGGTEIPSLTVYDTAATAIDGGHRHDQDWASSDVKGSVTTNDAELRTPIYLSNGILTTDFDNYSVVVGGVGGTATVRGKLRFAEVY